MGFRRIQHTIEYDAGDKIRLLPIGDIHLGSRGVNLDRLMEDIEFVEKNDDVYWIFMGDGSDAIGPRDKRWQVDMLAPDYREAAFDPHQGIFGHYINDFCEKFGPIMGKCLAIIDGNHERSVAYRNDLHLNSAIAGRLGAESLLLGYWGRVVVGFKRRTSKAAGANQSLVIDAGHGWQAGRSKGAKVNRMELEMGTSDADVLLRGHSHDSVVTVLDAWRSRGTKKDMPWPRIGLHTGTYVQGAMEEDKTGTPHVGFEELKMFTPSNPRSLGSHLITIEPLNGSSGQSFAYHVGKDY